MDIQKIPTTLKSTWDKVSNDGVISRNDYEKLLNSAAPNKKNSEIDKSEEKFLRNLKSSLENTTSKEGVSVKNLNFIDSSSSKDLNITDSERSWASDLKSKMTMLEHIPSQEDADMYSNIASKIQDKHSNSTNVRKK